MMSSSIINAYCKINGLVSAAGKLNNGRVCYVAKVDPKNSDRVVAFFTYDLSEACNFVSLKPESLTPMYPVAIKPSRISGNGLFATKDIKRGEVVLTEKPFYSQEIKRTHLASDSLIGQLPEPVREVLWGLTAEGPAQFDEVAAKFGMGPWGKRMALNSIGDDDDNCHLYPIISRINHACCGSEAHNVWWFAEGGNDKPRFITASRDIKDGEELFCDYLHYTTHSSSRPTSLAGYGIHNCSCILCKYTDSFSSALLKYKNGWKTVDGATNLVAIDLAYDAMVQAIDAMEAAACESGRATRASFEHMRFELTYRAIRVRRSSIGRALNHTATVAWPLALNLRKELDAELALVLAYCNGNTDHAMYVKTKSITDIAKQALDDYVLSW